MVSAALRGSISPPMLPPGLVDSLAATTDYYAEPDPPETVRLDPSAGRSADEEDSWRRVYLDPKAVALRDAEAVALERLDRLREDRMREDEIPTRSSEPVRPDPRPDWRAELR